MRTFKTTIIAAVLIALAAMPGTAPAGSAEGKLKVVVTSSAYAPIAEFIGGDKVKVSYIVKGNQDPHVVRPKPSLAVKLAEADVFVATGMDLEMWAPSLVHMSNYPDIRHLSIVSFTASTIANNRQPDGD